MNVGKEKEDKEQNREYSSQEWRIFSILRSGVQALFYKQCYQVTGKVLVIVSSLVMTGSYLRSNLSKR
jgi:hypothetical protein